MTFHATSPKQNWSYNFGQDSIYHTQDSRYHNTLATSTQLCEIINEFNKIHFRQIIMVFWKNFGKISAFSENKYTLCGSCQGIARSKRHNPFTQEILDKTQVCNYGQVIAISIFIFPFKGIEVHFVNMFFWDVKSKIILKKPPFQSRSTILLHYHNNVVVIVTTTRHYEVVLQSFFHEREYQNYLWIINVASTLWSFFFFACQKDNSNFLSTIFCKFSNFLELFSMENKHYIYIYEWGWFGFHMNWDAFLFQWMTFVI
jgi:hypothetical protein